MSEIIFEKSGGIATIIFNRPKKYNSVTRTLALQFQEALDNAAHDEEVRVILITGNGKAFCAGQDLEEVVDPDGPDMEMIIREHYNPIVTKIRSIEKPVVAAVQGVAAGAGANIALSCDIVVASDRASFMQAFSKIGLIPDSGGTYFLPRLIGFQRASGLMMMGDKISAHQAYDMGMLYKVVPHQVFDSYIEGLVVKLSKMPTKGLAFTKQALNASMNNTFTEQLQVEDVLQTKAGYTEDYQEGVAAFLEKRKPQFKGK